MLVSADRRGKHSLRAELRIELSNMFSRACEYGIRAMICIARATAEGQRVTLDQVASKTASPVAFTSKVLQKLARAGLVSSTKGPGGGFALPRAQAKNVLLSDIVSVIDGDAIYTACGLGLPHCSADKPCALHDRFMAVREELRNMLEATSMNDLATQMDLPGASFRC